MKRDSRSGALVNLDIQNTQDKLVQVQRRLSKLYLEKWGVQVGDVVECPAGDLLVSEVRSPSSGAKPWITGSLKNKNGKWGLRPHCAYSVWTKKRKEFE